MKTIFISQYVFPIGYSGTNRVLSLARGLVEHGNDVCVYVFRVYFKKDSILNKASKGIYHGIKYEYPIGRTYRLKFKITKPWDVFWGGFNTLKCIYNENKKDKIENIIITNDQPMYLFLFSKFSKWLGIKSIVFIVDEYPDSLRKGKEDVNLLSKILFRKSFNYINKFIYMTKAVRDYYLQFFPTNNTIKMLKVPITVEADRFGKVVHQHNSSNITYIGNFEIKKDGVDILVKAFTEVIKVKPNMQLILAGNSIKKDLQLIKELVKLLNINDNVTFLGRIHRDDVPNFLFDSKILVMARPSSRRAEGGFPSKLGEYLLTGIPTIVTSVGEIPIVLEDRKNIILAEPDNVLDFKDKILFVLNNYNHALAIAKRGKEFAISEFDYIYQSERIMDFLMQPS